MKDARFSVPDSLVLGRVLKDRVAPADQLRQRAEIEEILRRFRGQPGVILADEVGMGKTFVALGVAHSMAVEQGAGPVIVMAPPALLTKWATDLRSFAELYIERAVVEEVGVAGPAAPAGTTVIRFGIARHSIELMRLLDDAPRERAHIIFLAQGAMQRKQTDKWIRLALIGEALRRHAKGRGQLVKVKRQIHRFLARLISAVGEQKASDLGAALWLRLLTAKPTDWRTIYNNAVTNGARAMLADPVPKALARALKRKSLDLKPLARALADMPVRASGDDERLVERINRVRNSLHAIEASLWTDLLRETRWRSPLLVLDEAHHLKNVDAGASRQFRPTSDEAWLRTGDGAMANVFDRMLFLTATPFQLGHRELVNVLSRFADVRARQPELADASVLKVRIKALGAALTETQRAALALQQAWARLGLAADVDTEAWWTALRAKPDDQHTLAERACLDAFNAVASGRKVAEQLLRPWVIRHSKGVRWSGTEIVRRERRDGARMLDVSRRGGIDVRPEKVLPFYLAARSAARPSQDLLGEALSSSFEAFRNTRQNSKPEKDSETDVAMVVSDLAHSAWYLQAFDRAIAKSAAREHPKVEATVRRVVDLWEAGEKVVVFGFYVQTCRALRRHISEALEQRLHEAVLRRMPQRSGSDDQRIVNRAIGRAQDRYFDKPRSPGRRALDARLRSIVEQVAPELAGTADAGRAEEVMRRFLRATSSLARSFPLERIDEWSHERSVEVFLDGTDHSGLSWSDKLSHFMHFIATQCGTAERKAYLDAVSEVRAGGIQVSDQEDRSRRTVTLPNVQLAMGETRRDTRERLMRAFNTPFFPEILVCSQVMGEGVDLQRHCRHVIHHDLDWNPSMIEQRTGRIDRLGCKASGRSPIVTDLPFIAGAADERQYFVMTERERWFRIVMGEEVVEHLVGPDSAGMALLPEAVAEALAFDLSIWREPIAGERVRSDVRVGGR